MAVKQMRYFEEILLIEGGRVKPKRMKGRKKNTMNNSGGANQTTLLMKADPVDICDAWEEFANEVWILRYHAPHNGERKG